MGWRTVVVQKANQLSLTDGNLGVKDEAKELFLPTQQIQTLFIATAQGDISLNLINELSADNTSVIICDKKHRPSCQIIPFGFHNNLAGNIIDQTKWDKNVCEKMWQEIIKQKKVYIKSIVPNEGTIYALKMNLNLFEQMETLIGKEFDFNFFAGEIVYV